MTTLMLVILLGLSALAIDVGYMYAHRENLRNATDNAALAAALAVKEDSSVTDDDLSILALSEAKKIISDLASSDITVTRSPGTAEGYNYNWDSTAVGVTITQKKSAFFSRVLRETLKNDSISLASPSESVFFDLAARFNRFMCSFWAL
jgi:Flp pilus assembly protein TadG